MAILPHQNNSRLPWLSNKCIGHASNQSYFDKNFSKLFLFAPDLNAGLTLELIIVYQNRKCSIWKKVQMLAFHHFTWFEKSLLRFSYLPNKFEKSIIKIHQGS